MLQNAYSSFRPNALVHLMLGRPRGYLVALSNADILLNMHVILRFLFLQPAPFPLDDAATMLLVAA
jgi:hypothetical protein